ncbi:L-serine ammonia-lyase [Amnibacterium kyonggiense]|uniref:L-serine ammonia-lyase n=1 Tax=Amnibacterium kyonggiense TaxID=595671 RepID=UPI001060D95D|nr:L-serine ammonia-lyase [Amnibacterium kyonggiense]
MSAYVSVLDLFSIGIGPSSSHTVGPMRAAKAFVTAIGADLERVERVRVRLYGSLGATGAGHGTPGAIVAGLEGHDPETCPPALLREEWARVGDGGVVLLAGTHPVVLAQADVELAPLTRLERHTNGMRFTALDAAGEDVRALTFYSIGGGFIEGETERAHPERPVPFPYATATELLATCRDRGMTIAEVALANEAALGDRGAALAGIDAIWAAMRGCIEGGMSEEGVLPGSLGVRRRAAALRRRLAERAVPLESEEWLHAYALAVNEQNAAGERVVTAPTNGAAGIVPAVLMHLGSDRVAEYLLTATAIGSVIAANASISGAEAGCQGEVGSACAMAAAGATAVLGGTPEQIENAAEIALEHNLGLTCDPVGGLVQVPCIERNAVGASRAVTAARMALYGDGRHVVSLDTCIETMRQTGADMSTKYKETSTGGLAVNVVEC